MNHYFKKLNTVGMLIAIAISSKPLLAETADTKPQDFLGGYYRSPKFCAPGLEEYAEYLSTISTNATNEDVGREIEKLNAAIRGDEQKLADQQINHATRYLTLLGLGNRYLARATASMDHVRHGMNRHDRCAKEPSASKAPPSSTTTDVSKALGVFRQAVSEYQDLPGSDKAMYGLIVSQVRASNENAPKFNGILQQKFPRSKFLAMANLAIGEYYFSISDWAQAATMYQRVANSQDKFAAAYAQYKSAWVQVMLRETHGHEADKGIQEIVEEFKRAASMAAVITGRSSRYPLATETMRDIALIWAEDDVADSAGKFFKATSGREYFRLFLARLGNRLVYQKRPRDASRVFLRMAREVPNNPESPELYKQILSWTFSSQNPEWVVDILRDMTSVHLGKSAWRRHFDDDEEVLKRATIAVEESLSQYALELARIGETKNDKLVLSAAAEVYGLYLTQFSEGQKSYDIRFSYANVLGLLGKHREAQQQYVLTAKSRGSFGSHYKESWLAALRQQELVVKDIMGIGVRDQTVLAKGSVPAEVDQLIRLNDEAPIFVPHEALQADSRLRAAELLLEFGVVEGAAQRFARIVVDFPETSAGAQAASRILHDYAARKDWPGLLTWSERLDRIAAINHGALGALISQSLRESLIELAHSEEGRGNYRESARYLLMLGNHFPKDPIADRALYNAMASYLRANVLPDAIAVGTRLVADYPTSAVRPDGLAALADAHAALCQYDMASRYYSQFAAEYPRDVRTLNALFNAAVNERALGHHDQASMLFARFVSSQRGDSRAVVASIEANTETMSGDRRPNGDAGVWRQFRALRSQITKSGDNEAERAQLAQAMFRAVQREAANVLSDSSLGGANVVDFVRDKTRKVAELVAHLRDIEQLGDPEFVVAANVLNGQLQESLAATLLAPPDRLLAPVGEGDNLRSRWERQGLDAQDAAQRQYSIALQSADKFGVDSLWVGLAKSRLTTQQQAAFQSEVRELYAAPDFLLFKPARHAADNLGILFRLDKKLLTQKEAKAGAEEIAQVGASLKNNTRDVNGRLLRAHAYLFLRDFKQAEADARRVLTADHRSRGARLALAKLSLSKGLPEQVDTILAPMTPKSAGDSDYYVSQAIAAFRRLDYTVGKDYLDAAIALNPADAAAYMNLGLVYLQFRQVDLAARAFGKVRELLPDDHNSLLHLAVIKSVTGDLKTAEDMLEDAEEQGADPELVTYNRAILMQKRGDYDAALKSLGKYTELVKQDAEKVQSAERLRQTIVTSRAMKNMMPVIQEDE